MKRVLFVLMAWIEFSEAAADPALVRTRREVLSLVKGNAAQGFRATTVGVEIIVPFFADVAYTGIVTHVEQGYRNTRIVRGYGSSGKEVSILLAEASDGRILTVNDPRQSRLFQCVSLADGGYEYREYDLTRQGKILHEPSVFPPDEGILIKPSIAEVSEISSYAVQAAGATVLDILFIFDTRAQTWVANNGGMTAFANLAVARMNTALQTSGIACSFRLVYAGAKNYTFSGDSSSPLSAALTPFAGNTGVFSDLETLRTTYGADLATLMIDHGSAYGYVGQGYLLSSTSSSGNPRYGYTVCAIRSVNLTHTLTHEVGHNLGCHHAVNQASDPGPNTAMGTYASGYYFTAAGTRYHTIMAYNSDGYGNTYSATDYFSTPLKTYGSTSVAVGTAATADNARVIRERMNTVASYRDATFSIVAAPLFSVQSNTTFTSSLVVGISCATAGATIRYTTNGVEPTASSIFYASPLTLTATTMIKAKAFKTGLSESTVSVATYYRNNDNFFAAESICGANGRVMGINVGATKETGEPSHSSSGGASIWWKWVVPVRGTGVVTTAGSNFDTMLAIYTGKTVSALTRITSNDDSGQELTSACTFSMDAGKTYFIAVDGWRGSAGNIVLNWTFNAVEGPAIMIRGKAPLIENTYFELQFQGMAGTTYQIQSKTTLADTAWMTRQTLSVAMDGIQVVRIPVVNTSVSGFYRIVAHTTPL